MSLDKAIKHGKERRRTYKARGKPGEYTASCRPHGAGLAHPCPYCARARLIHVRRLRALVALAELDTQTQEEPHD